MRNINLTLLSMHFLSYFRLCALAPRFEINAHIFTLKYGRFTPRLRYNMDQVPLPFVVSQESTCTDENDKDIHISAPSVALRKWQFTMHMFFNAGEGEDRDGCTVMACKGSHKGRRTAIEKTPGIKRCPSSSRRAHGVDTEIAKELAVDFVEHRRENMGICG